MLSSERSNIPVCMDPYGDKNDMHPVLGSYLLKVIYYISKLTIFLTRVIVLLTCHVRVS